MKVRCYAGLKSDSIRGFEKFRRAIEANDFASAQISKIGHNLYRARLGRSARLLFSFYAHAGSTDCLVLEHLPNHDYEKSRFLNRGAGITAARVGPVDNTSRGQPAQSVDGCVVSGIDALEGDQPGTTRLPEPCQRAIPHFSTRCCHSTTNNRLFSTCRHHW